MSSGYVEIPSGAAASSSTTTTSINGLTGDVTLAGGPGIAVTTSGSTITVTDIDDTILVYQILGSTVQAQTVGINLANLSTNAPLASGTMRLTPVYVGKAATMTGVRLFQSTQGVYTSNNYNGVGLYSFSNGVCTLVASSTDDGTIWQAAAGTLITKAFSATYSATPGLYFTALLYNASAQTTAPAPVAQLTLAPPQVGDFTNGSKLSCTIASQNTLPASIALNSTTAAVQTVWVGLYV